MPALLYLIGPPGAGKSTAMGELLAGTSPYLVKVAPGLTLTEHHWRGQHVAAQLGKPRPGFPGTDTLPYNALPVACAYMAVAARLYPLLLGEGDRLAHPRLWTAATAAGYAVTVARLVAPDDVAAARRAARGTEQNEAWVRGRATRVARLAESWPVVDVDATAPPAAVADHLAALLPAAPWRTAAA